MIIKKIIKFSKGLQIAMQTEMPNKVSCIKTIRKLGTPIGYLLTLLKSKCCKRSLWGILLAMDNNNERLQWVYINNWREDIHICMVWYKGLDRNEDDWAGSRVRQWLTEDYCDVSKVHALISPSGDLGIWLVWDTLSLPYPRHLVWCWNLTQTELN